MNYIVLQGCVLSELMSGSVLILGQVLSERGAFRANEVVFYFYYSI